MIVWLANKAMGNGAPFRLLKDGNFNNDEICKQFQKEIDLIEFKVSSFLYLNLCGSSNFKFKFY